MGVIMLNYKRNDTKLTLREGIKELRDFEGVLGDMSQQVGPDMETVLKAHDAVHVVFGCDTSMSDEALAHFVMIFATDVKLNDMREVAKNKDHRRIVRSHNKKQILKVLLGVGGDLYRVLKLKRKMDRKWSWFGFEYHLDKPISEIRREFGITPISCRSET